MDEKGISRGQRLRLHESPNSLLRIVWHIDCDRIDRNVFAWQGYFDIDFLGGTSVVFTLTEPATAEEVRRHHLKIFDKDEKGNRFNRH